MTSRPPLTRAKYKKAINQIAQNEPTLQEDMDFMKGNIDKVKGNVGQTMCALANLMAGKDEEQKVPPKKLFMLELMAFQKRETL